MLSDSDSESGLFSSLGAGIVVASGTGLAHLADYKLPDGLSLNSYRI